MKPRQFAKENQKVWGIRAGIAGAAHSRFLEGEVIGLSDAGMGDLRKIPLDRQSFYAAYRRLQLTDRNAEIIGIVSKFFRFAHEISIGDLVVYPSRNQGRVYVGRVTGEYTYSNQQSENLPHRRTVKWLCNFQRSQLSITAQEELGAARTFFEVKKHSEEIQSLVSQLIYDNSHANVPET